MVEIRSPDHEFFSCRKLNSSTFLLVEADGFGERPFIYAKILPTQKYLVLSDTGCGSSSDSGINTLRDFLETFLVPDNDNLPLNPHLGNGKPSLSYLIICTHCHYDHILGIPEFLDANPTIVASAAGKTFIESDLPAHSLCKYLDLPTPAYTVSHWAADLEHLLKGHLQILQTPGHTPDELAWYDSGERHLYVGDSFYDRVSEDGAYTQPIIFPPHGDLVVFMDSLEKLSDFVGQQNRDSGLPTLKIGCGHITSSADAASTLDEVKSFFDDVIAQRVPVIQTVEKFGVVINLWQADGNPRFSLQAPRFLVERARKHWKHQV